MAQKLLDFSDAPEKREMALFIKIRSSIGKKLKEITKRHGVSQVDVLERLIEAAYSEMEGGGRRGRKRQVI